MAVWERVRDSNKAWVACLLCVLALSVYFIVSIGPQDTLDPVRATAPPHRETGPFDDAKHRRFIEEFERQMRKQGVRAEARFVNAGVLDLTIPQGTNLDDIRFVSKMAAVGVGIRFNNAAIVSVYSRSPGPTGKITLEAVTQWSNRRGDFEVRLLRAGAKPEETLETQPAPSE